MKVFKLFITTLIVFTSIICKAQNNSDSLAILQQNIALGKSIEWVKENLKTYVPYQKSIFTGVPEYAKRKISCYDCTLIIETTDASGVTTKLILPIKDIDVKNIMFNTKPELEDNIEMVMQSNQGTNVFMYESSSDNGWYKKDFRAQVTILLHKNCKNQNIPEQVKEEMLSIQQICSTKN